MGFLGSNCVRCPFCVLGDNFRPMVPVPDGAHSCENCGHMVFPLDSMLQCVCAKCERLKKSRPLLREEKRSSVPF